MPLTAVLPILSSCGAGYFKAWQLGTHEYAVHTWHELEVAYEKGELNDSHIKDMRYLASVFGRENG